MNGASSVSSPDCITASIYHKASEARGEASIHTALG
jgi:hypothetical protein